VDSLLYQEKRKGRNKAAAFKKVRHVDSLLRQETKKKVRRNKIKASEFPFCATISRFSPLVIYKKKLVMNFWIVQVNEEPMDSSKLTQI
jgi:hypothetical protein